MSGFVSYETVNLERLTFAVHHAVSRELIDEMATPIQAGWLSNRIADELVYQVRVGIASQHLDRATVRYPADWKQSVKAALYQWCKWHWPWFGEYAPKRWPVREHVVTINVKALYPKIAMPDQRHTVTVLRQETDTPWQSIRPH